MFRRIEQMLTRVLIVCFLIFVCSLSAQAQRKDFDSFLTNLDAAQLELQG